MSEKLVSAMADMREDEALMLVKDLLAEGTDPMDILGAAREAMDIVGQRFETGQYFLPELIMAGEMLSQITDLVKPELAKAPQAESKGSVVIGSVAGDIHDIGKNIVTFMLDVNGFEVHDLGVDVSPQAFVDAIQTYRADVVGLSGFLTLAFDAMKDTVAAIEAAGLRDSVKIMVGGGQVTDKIREYTGADAYGDDAMEAVGLAKSWIGG
ncbi:MAG: cobalamin-dependent protein [Anaerolineae bacterium]|jgi:5-methyltetrahydrofolate--homocysteine methyltransferase